MAKYIHRIAWNGDHYVVQRCRVGWFGIRLWWEFLHKTYWKDTFEPKGTWWGSFSMGNKISIKATFGTYFEARLALQEREEEDAERKAWWQKNTHTRPYVTVTEEQQDKQ